MRRISPLMPIQLHCPPPLDQAFYPAALFNYEFTRNLEQSGVALPLIIGLERLDGSISRLSTNIFPAEHAWAKYNAFYAERLLKFILWQRGGWKVYIGGPQTIGSEIKSCYSAQGSRSFDYHFMGEDIYQRTFQVVACQPGEVPPGNEVEQALGRQLDGCRIGFDLGASDIKVSAVIDGEAVFSQEIEWAPRLQRDPNYHREHIRKAITMAAAHLPRLDAIGGSSAGVIIDRRPMVASIFRGVPRERFDEVHNIFLDIQKEMGVPLEIVNDGEVSALAGSMSLGKNAVLGIAMGSSEASGYVTRDGNITNWLNELAFAPIDYNPEAPADEWSGDPGAGSQYLSQQCVFRLSPKVGIHIPEDLSAAQKLKFVQDLLEQGHPGAIKIWESIGCYLGYAIAHYASFYTLEHVLILGRVTSGSGGAIILENATQVLDQDFDGLAKRIHIHLPDEMSRRLGQSIVAASLPMIPPGEKK